MTKFGKKDGVKREQYRSFDFETEIHRLEKALEENGFALFGVETIKVSYHPVLQCWTLNASICPLPIDQSFGEEKKALQGCDS